MLALLSSIVAFILANPAATGLIVAGLGVLVRLLLRKLAKDKAAKWESNLHAGVSIAYDLVNDYAKTSPNKVDDKIALGLRFLRDALGPDASKLSPIDEAKAKQLFKAMHGRELSGGDPHSVLKGK